MWRMTNKNSDVWFLPNISNRGSSIPKGFIKLQKKLRKKFMSGKTMPLALAVNCFESWDRVQIYQSDSNIYYTMVVPTPSDHTWDRCLGTKDFDLPTTFAIYLGKEKHKDV